MNLYPPLLGAGIRIKEVSAAYDRVVVEMKLTWWNANFARTHFGGSLYMMIDPFYVLMLKHQLGDGYVVWDREATIHTSERPGGQRLVPCSNSPLPRLPSIAPNSRRTAS